MIVLSNIIVKLITLSVGTSSSSLGETLPGRHDPISRPEGEVVEVLVEGVARGLASGVRGLKDRSSA